MENGDTPSVEAKPEVGVGPWEGQWPEDPRFDPQLLREGDRRNVLDHYRYWSMDAIRADLDQRRHPIHLAVENWEKDLNLGAIVRTANAFLVSQVHIIGEKRWNRRGAMVTDRYQHVRHHPSLAAFSEWVEHTQLPVLGIDILENSQPIETYDLPRECVMLFGQEGPGMSDAAQAICDVILHISQFGSTRSINASAAAAIAMHSWIRRHEFGQKP